MKLGHIHLKVSDLTRAETFYTDRLGFRVTERLGNSFSFLSLGEAHHDLALQHSREVHQEKSPLYHMAFELDSLETLKTKLEILSLPYSLVDHGISIAAYFSDPEGNGIELYVDTRNERTKRPFWGGHSSVLSQAALNTLQSRPE